jgi:hypothetical protein
VWEQFSDKEARAIKDDPKFWKVKHNSLNTNVMNRYVLFALECLPSTN